MKTDLLIWTALIFALGFLLGMLAGLIKGRSIYRVSWEEIQRYHKGQDGECPSEVNGGSFPR